MTGRARPTGDQRLPQVLEPTLTIERDAPLPTWFKVGGRADRLARPRTAADVRRCLEIDPRLVVLGDGANLLVDDAGVSSLVVALHDPADPAHPMTSVRWGEGHAPTFAPAGASLFKMIPEAVRRGLAGLENLAGIPATIGGAVVMNAGGAFGQIADVVARVHAMDRDGREVVLDRRDIGFGYRRSGLSGLVILGAELTLTPEDPARLRARFKEVMEYKKKTQPMDANSAGCAFKNPDVPADLAASLGATPAPGAATARVSAGMLIDKAGCKGLRIGSAEVSQRHGNFLFAHDGGKAADVIALMDAVERRVAEAFGVRLHREVVVWGRAPRG